MNLFNKTFPNKPVVIGMVHLFGDYEEDILERAKREIDIYIAHDVIPLVENYGPRSTDTSVMLALSYLNTYYPTFNYGVNFLGDWSVSRSLANIFNATFIQIDSVVGHLPSIKEISFLADLHLVRNNYSNFAVLGGVRFKYQRLCSKRTLQEDLTIGSQFTDAIVVTGEGTNIETPKSKVLEFRETLSSFPLIVGAGVTINNLPNYINHAEGYIIGSWFKDFHKTDEELNPDYVESFMEKLNELKG